MIFTYADNDIQTVEKLTESRSGDLTRYSRGNSLTINGSTFNYSGMVAFSDDCYTSKDFADVEKPASRTNENLSTNNSYIVYLNNKGVYLQIVRPGCGEPIKDGEQVNLLCRFSEYNIASSTRTLQNNTDYVFDVDKMSVTRVGSTYTASFSTGLMYEVYGASVPSGWLAPLPYVKVGRPVSEGDEIAKVRIIVPHTQGHTTANSYVNPYFYDITFERER